MIYQEQALHMQVVVVVSLHSGMDRAVTAVADLVAVEQVAVVQVLPIPVVEAEVVIVVVEMVALALLLCDTLALMPLPQAQQEAQL
jgi:hypothetical protein